MFLGMDIGYSNLKIAFGNALQELTLKLLPIGAGPKELLPRSINGAGAQGIHVTMGSEVWVAGVEPDRLQGWARELHADYPATDTYRALFYAALLSSEQPTIDMLVTGLPVSQSADPAAVAALKERLIGNHQVTPKRAIEVKDVAIVPQPAGAYLDALSTASDETRDVINEGRAVVIDPGFFSVDWVVLSEGEVRMKSSGTSLKAMSVLLADADQRIQADHGAGPGSAAIEKAIRAGRKDVLVLGQRIDLERYLDDAAKATARAALVPMRESMREDSAAIDIVLLAGGGAKAYQAAAAELFPRSKILVSENPVMANARGFWQAAASYR